MTHDELKDKLKKQHDYWSNLVHYTKPEFYENTVDQRNGWSALLAVVKLHSPTMAAGMEICEECSNSEFSAYKDCKTIQAIEKELK